MSALSPIAVAVAVAVNRLGLTTTTPTAALTTSTGGTERSVGAGGAALSAELGEHRDDTRKQSHRFCMFGIREILKARMTSSTAAHSIADPRAIASCLAASASLARPVSS